MTGYQRDSLARMEAGSADIVDVPGRARRGIGGVAARERIDHGEVFAADRLQPALQPLEREHAGLAPQLGDAGGAAHRP
ncbi:hypothetical protein BKK81_10200 [Cupriavidus sp. USMAHM13]|uniref:hypothetical protein n=1 Tax=Cupriavidus sp. USMAHM13 TaxID=1389192 RepID=UPI0008A704B4|nr:hypothetical protein [Cupriavidus sp. USMAHM13]AOY99592.1 hypothetical protein BKK81_10200 [Cupriavidus sp. USMAHM13]